MNKTRKKQRGQILQYFSSSQASLLLREIQILIDKTKKAQRSYTVNLRLCLMATYLDMK